jgi:hypothetical protein
MYQRRKAIYGKFRKWVSLDQRCGLRELQSIAQAYEQLGKYDEARAWAQKYQQASGAPAWACS